jgi:hypothetical protein
LELVRKGQNRSGHRKYTGEPQYAVMTTLAPRSTHLPRVKRGSQNAVITARASAATLSHCKRR